MRWNVSEKRIKTNTPLHLELHFDNTLNFIVHHDKWRMYLKNIWIYYHYSTLFLNSGTLQAQGLKSKDINAQISNQNNIDDLHETLACLSTGFIYIAEIEVIIHNISKLWKVIHSKTVE